MRYFKLLKEYHDDSEIFCFCENDCGREQYELLEGRVISNWNESPVFYYNPSEGDNTVDYVHNDLSWFIISSKFKSILENIDKGSVQYLSVDIKDNENNNLLKGYTVANIINVVDAIDYTHSIYSVFELEDEKVYNFTKYALKESEIKGHIFKLKGDEIPIFVSEKVKELIEQHNITGCDFLEVKVVS
ncbi:Imm43 family immunity protein [Virgibacillus proomii]|uniref:Imm43 family immunity protein n=1 Tax=Virgibacillus proomii TaxID=84407 RepID=UPI00098685FD|nr:DUF1629 domain-containing protein [Virgibacillus proomii]